MAKVPDDEVIILNKPFLGDWLDKPENIGHEIIDFLSTDSGELYVYNNPYGQCPDDIWVDGTTGFTRATSEKFVAKYLILTSAEHEKDFDILYVVELEEKLHRQHTTKHKVDIPDDERKELARRQDAIKEIIRERKISYNGKILYDIYKNDDSLYVTFKAKKIYKANNPIHVSGLTYDFRRNKGYLYSNEFENDEFENDYKTVKDLVEAKKETGELTQFFPSKIDSALIKKLSSNKTFIDLIKQESNEQIFTNVLFSLLSDAGLFKPFCESFKKADDIFMGNETFDVFREATIVGGRIDVCAESNSQRVVIENKINSGLNGIKPASSETQLNKYYEWALDKKMKPLCFITVPDARKSEISEEIKRFDTRNAGPVKMEEVFQPVTYGEIADFIHRQKGSIIKSYPYSGLVDEIEKAFRKISKLTSEDLYVRLFLDATM